jgi:SlyX protein
MQNNAENKARETMDLKNIEQRATELEIKMSFAENTIETLNKTLYKQQLQIDRLQQELRLVRAEMASSQDSQSAGSATSLRDEIPPHY